MSKQANTSKVLKIPPKGCYRARCFCMWWIVTEKQDPFTCAICGVQIIRAQKEDWEAVGYVLGTEVMDAGRKGKEQRRYNKSKPEEEQNLFMEEDDAQGDSGGPE